MRLLNASTLLPEWFPARNEVPPYAILSHTWGKDEVSYEDMMCRPLASREDKQTSGLLKIIKCAERALGDELDWIWVDTCKSKLSAVYTKS
jgi:hypothetical protein